MVQGALCAVLEFMEWSSNVVFSKMRDQGAPMLIPNKKTPQTNRSK